MHTSSFFFVHKIVKSDMEILFLRFLIYCSFHSLQINLLVKRKL